MKNNQVKSGLWLNWCGDIVFVENQTKSREWVCSQYENAKFASSGTYVNFEMFKIATAKELDAAGVPNTPEMRPVESQRTKIKALTGKALMKAVINQIIDHPETWDQGQDHSDCGTKHCILGWAQVLSGKKELGSDSFTEAKVALGLNDDQAEFLWDSNRSWDEIYDFAKSHIAGKLPESLAGYSFQFFSPEMAKKL